MKELILIITLLLINQGAGNPQQVPKSVLRTVGYGCLKVPPDWHITYRTDVDWCYGQLRSSSDDFRITFEIGMVAPWITGEPQRKFEWLKVGKLSDGSSFQYALDSEKPPSFHAELGRANFHTVAKDNKSLERLLTTVTTFSRGENCKEATRALP